MPSATIVPTASAPRLAKLSAAAFDQMREAGIFAPGHRRIELVDGELWDSCPSHTRERLKLTVEQYDRMGEAGIFGEDDHIELLDGELFEMPPAGDWHNAGVTGLNMEFTDGARGQRIVSIQNGIRLAIRSAPEPDMAVLRFRADYYREGGAHPGDVLLLVEVADSSLRHDRDLKLPLYAEAGIPEVWIVTREPKAIEVYSEPRDGAYTVQRTYGPGEALSAAALPDVRVAVSDITG